MYNRGLFYKWVPGIVQLLLIIFLTAVVLLIKPINAANISLMASSTGVLMEYYMWGNYATIIGFSIVLPFIWRNKYIIMKKLTGIFIVFFCTIVANAQISVIPYVDERTELLSIVFRLAGAKEYVNDSLKNYMAEIDTCFAVYKEYEVVRR